MKLKAASFALILSVLVSAMPAAAGSAQKDIVDTAVAAGTFNTLATALQAAGGHSRVAPQGREQGQVKGHPALPRGVGRRDCGAGGETLFGENHQWPGPETDG